MDIGHDWHLTTAFAQPSQDMLQVTGILHRGRSNTNEFTTHGRELHRLHNRSFSVHRVTGDHRLDSNRVSAADSYLSDHHLARNTPAINKRIVAILHSLGRIWFNQYGCPVTQHFRYSLH